MALWCEFTTHHLYAALCDVVHGSLIVENRRRLEHLENAIRRLDKDSTRLKLEADALRQEEITEEIEVILRSAEALADAEQARSGTCIPLRSAPRRPAVEQDQRMHVHVVCPHCLGTNRMPAARIDQAPNCGRCHEPLFRGRAEAFDAAGFERLIANTELPILVDFWAPWCGPCRTMGPNVDAAARSLEPRVRVAKVDVEANPTLGQRFRVQSIPTLTLISGGRELARSSGVMSPQQIVAWVVPQLVQGAE